MSLSGGKSKSSQSSQQTSNSWSYGTDIWGTQAPYLQDLYARAQGNLGMGGNAGQQYLDAAGATIGQGIQGLQGANEALRGFLNPTMDPSVSAYATNLGQQFREQFLPELQGGAALAGGLGGSRQQIGAALGAQRAMQTLGDYTAQVYSGQQDRALAAAQAMAGNAGQLGAFAELQGNLGGFAQSLPWYGLNQYAGLLGSPVMRDLGGYSTSQSTSKGKSGGWNFSGGLGSG